DIDVKAQIESAFKQKGYKITQNPKEAKYMLQGNILKVGKSDLREAKSLLDSGFGGTGLAAGLTAGALAGSGAYALGGDYRTAAGIGLAGAALGFVGDAMVEDVLYVMVTDLQIRERPLEGEVITQTQQAKLAQGSSTTTSQEIKGGKVEWKTYRTRIVSTANKMNLEFEEAKPALEMALSKSISGVF
ncbi:MAG: complement resistance protein TraT, partial [Campylobacterales bacterium]|nr:complement resistance protein TraT [Campylobacterales bacterium]